MTRRIMGTQRKADAGWTSQFAWMVVAINVGGNLVGFFLVQLLIAYAQPFEHWQGFAGPSLKANLAILAVLVPSAMYFLIVLARPVDSALRKIYAQKTVDWRSLQLARRRVINMPFYAAAMNLAAWIVPALLFPFLFQLHTVKSPWTVAIYVIYGFSNAAMITLLVFVLLEHACRKTVIPVLFPDGRLRDQKGTLWLSIRKQLMIMYLAICLIPMFQVALMISSRAGWTFDGAEACEALRSLGTFSWILFAFTAMYGLWLAVLFSRNLSQPAEEIMAVTQRVKEGDYDARVHVVSNDEIGVLGDRVNEMAIGLKEREEIREVFNLVTSPEIGREILSMKPFEGGEVRRVTLLFADLRGFTSLAERLPPRDVLKAINSYFSAMTDAIVRHNGVVLQYVGDEIEAVFGAPLDNVLHADKAVDAALAMRAALETLNGQREAEGHEPLRHGIGIHTGSALAGIVGGQYKISYALVDDTVNIASRIQDLTKEMGADILLSGETYCALTVSRNVSPPVEVAVKGKVNTLDVYRLW
ncbi:MAG: adenylate/guanylate cyclase domain-containing protein [Desulfomonilaceae bacterium]